MKEARAAGIADAKKTKTDFYNGPKPCFTLGEVNLIMQSFDQCTGLNRIARDMKMRKFTISRITHNTDNARETLAK